MHLPGLRILASKCVKDEADDDDAVSGSVQCCERCCHVTVAILWLCLIGDVSIAMQQSAHLTAANMDRIAS